MTVDAIGAATAVNSANPSLLSLGQANAPTTPKAEGAFADILTDMVGSAETKLDEANSLVRQFAVDDSIPVHKVTFAIEEARLSVEMMLQVRTRLVEGYREIMNLRM